MRSKLCLSLVAFVQLFAVSMAQDKPAAAISPRSASTATYITHVTVINPENGKEMQDRTVIISGDRISEVRDSEGMKLPACTKVVDGTSKYLIPGLWDMHVHAVLNSSPAGKMITELSKMKFKFSREAAAVAHWSAPSTFWPELYANSLKLLN